MNFKKIFRSPYFFACITAILSIHFVREYSKFRLSAPPALVQVGDWELTDHNNQPFGTKDLKGKVVIANFFFTRCPTICPGLTQSMIEVRKRFLKQLDYTRFVSISSDPDFDSPEVLRAYRENYQINFEDWKMLTAPKDHLLAVVEGQMKLPLGESHHLSELALFDQKGDLRGKFNTEPTGLAALEKAAKHLIDNP